MLCLQAYEEEVKKEVKQKDTKQKEEKGKHTEPEEGTKSKKNGNC